MLADERARAGQYNKHEVADRQTTQLIGIAQGLIADGHLNDGEIHFLHKWLVANEAVQANPLISLLVQRIDEILADGVIDEDERADLHNTISALTGSDFELGELSKSSTLPLCDPAPDIIFDGNRFCFTGTFTFGRRRDCEQAAIDRGASAGGLTQKTAFLVIGAYATESWKQETFGRKIEKAVELREAGFPIAIVSEKHWADSLNR